MEWKEVDICQLCDSVSETYKGNASEVVLINTSDVLDGKCLNHEYVPNKKLKGQFKKTFRKGDILYSEIRPANKRFCFVDFEPKDYIASTKLMVLRAHEDVDPQYLYQILRSNDTLAQLQMLAESRSGTFPQITYSELSNIMVSLPSQKAQKNIVSILSSLDRKIELNNKINADLEEMAQAIFKNWFVDFEPFKDGKFVDSELGMIPEGWKVGTLKDLLYLRKDSIKAANKGNLPYLPIDTIPMHCLVATDFKSNDEAKSSLQTFEQNDIVVGAMRVYFHRVILAPCKGITRTTCFVLSVKNENALAYSLMQCNQDEAISFAEKTSKGSTMPYAVWDGGYGEYKVVIPPSEVMKSFNDLLSNFFSKMNKNTIENSRLSFLRDTLLPRLMSGELEVPE